MSAASALYGVKRDARRGKTILFWAASHISRHSEGFRPRTVRLWCAEGEPTGEELKIIAQKGLDLTGELRAWLSRSKVSVKQCGTIYFVTNDQGLIKIGFTKDLKRRLTQLKNASGIELKLIATIAGNAQMELELQHRFRPHNVRGEWFRAEWPLTDFIATAATAA